MIEPTVTCSKLTIEALEQGVKYIYSIYFIYSLFKVDKFTIKTYNTVY